MFNPRWPHTLTVFTHSLDERGAPVTDDNGDPISTKMTLKQVSYDSRWNPIRTSDGSFSTTDVTELPWGYRTSTGGIKDSGEVFAADYKISTPMMLTHLPEGTVVTLTDYDHTFSAIVKKQTTYNWGTNIWLDAPGNNADGVENPAVEPGGEDTPSVDPSEDPDDDGELGAEE